MRLFFALACLAVMGGCASAPAAVCANADEISPGETVNSCSGNATLSVAEHRTGVTDTNGSVCNAQRIYNDASRGELFPDACVARDDEQLISAYAEGRRLYRQERKLGFLKKKLKHTKFDLNDIAHRTAEVEAELMSAPASRHKRAALVRQLEALSTEQRMKEEQLQSIAEAYETAKTTLSARRKHNAAAINVGVQKVIPVQDISTVE